VKTTVFYSYKGGLGRSLALAWCARALARESRPTVAIDFDLEAPGLAYKLGFSIDDDLGPGLVDLLLRYQSGQSPPDDLTTWLKKVDGGDHLWLLPAGPGVSGRYWRDLAAINWERMFFGGAPDGVRFFHWLRQAIDKALRPDYLLVDARTGVTEMSGAALTLMADQIIALVGTSLEGIHGTRQVLRGVVESSRGNQRTQPRIALVLSRMPAQLLPDDLQRLRRATRDEICEEADPLSATVHCELPFIVRSEPCLQTNERDALLDDDLRVHIDYREILSWITGVAIHQYEPDTYLAGESIVETLSQSVDLHRRLAAQRPDLYEADLAACLSSFSRALAELGRRDEALAAESEAVQHYRTLAQSRPGAFLRNLATHLENVGVHLANLGRHEDAVRADEEAMQIYAIGFRDQGKDPVEDNSARRIHKRWVDSAPLGAADSDQTWQSFVERYRPFVRGILGGVLGNGAKATAAEEEFWGYLWLSGALQHADRGRGFRASLSGIVRNFARSFARSRGMTIADELALDSIPAGDEAVNEMKLWADNVIENSLAQLRAESAVTAMAIASFYGLAGGLRPGKPMSAGEVAAASGKTTQGIYMLLFRGRKRLRGLIEDELREGCQDQSAYTEELQALLGTAASRLSGLLDDG
jgi:hypothetical protein